jgi:autophagy-related protein 9
MSYPFAARYVDQFPKDKTVQISRFVSFIAGALAAVLAIATVFDHELFLGFEITKDRTVLFYLGVFGSIWAVARGVAPEDNTVFDPEFAMRNVMEFIHYMPTSWQDKLHSDEVRREFSGLYQMKLVIFVEEILSMIYTPFLLWFALPACSDRIIDFFREFTVHVDGLGYVCSFAVFDFKKGGNLMAQHHRQQLKRQGEGADGEVGSGLRDEYYAAKDGKMLASYYGFLDNYGSNNRIAMPYVGSTTRQQFQSNIPPPPSTLQGLNSPTLLHKRPGTAGGTIAVPGTQSIYKTPRFGAVGQGISASTALPSGRYSPPPSMLLDHHHQPSSSGFRSVGRLPQAHTHGPHHAARSPPTELLKEEPSEDDRESGDIPPANLTGDSVDGQGDFASPDRNFHSPPGSHLGESFMTTTAAVARADDDEEDENEGEGAGVLGLLYQFQREHMPGRGGPVPL